MNALDPKKLRSRAVFKHSGTLFCLCRDPKRGRLHAGSSDYGIHVFDPASDEKQSVAVWRGHDNYVSGLAWLGGGAAPRVVSASFDRQLVWWDPESGEARRRVREAHAGWIRDLVAFRDGSRLVTAGDDMLVKIWDAETGELLRSLEGHAKKTPQGHVTALYTVAVSADGSTISSCDRVGEVRVWESETGKQVQAFRAPTLYTYDPRQRKRSIGGIRSAAFSDDGRRLAVGGIAQIGNVDGLGAPSHVELWSPLDGEKIAEITAGGHKALINHLEFVRGSSLLAGAGGGADDGVIAFWDTARLEGTAPVEGKEDGKGEKEEKKPESLVHKQKASGHVHAFCLDVEKRELFTAGHERLEIWSLEG